MQIEITIVNAMPDQKNEGVPAARAGTEMSVGGRLCHRNWIHDGIKESQAARECFDNISSDEGPCPLPPYPQFVRGNRKRQKKKDPDKGHRPCSVWATRWPSSNMVWVNYTSRFEHLFQGSLESASVWASS